MATNLARLSTSCPTGAALPSRRKSARRPFNGKVVIGAAGYDSSEGLLCNISPFGCNVVAEADCLRPGRIVSLRITAKRTIHAIVRWTRDGSAGLEFLRPIDLAEAEWLDLASV